MVPLFPGMPLDRPDAIRRSRRTGRVRGVASFARRHRRRAEPRAALGASMASTPRSHPLRRPSTVVPSRCDRPVIFAIRHEGCAGLERWTTGSATRPDAPESVEQRLSKRQGDVCGPPRGCPALPLRSHGAGVPDPGDLAPGDIRFGCLRGVREPTACLGDDFEIALDQLADAPVGGEPLEVQSSRIRLDADELGTTCRKPPLP